MDTEAPDAYEGSPHTIELSSNLDHHSPFSPMEVTRALVEPHGAVVLLREVEGEDPERFELTGAEVEALIAALRRRRAIVRRYHASRSGNAPSVPS